MRMAQPCDWGSQATTTWKAAAAALETRVRRGRPGHTSAPRAIGVPAATTASVPLASPAATPVQPSRRR